MHKNGIDANIGMRGFTTTKCYLKWVLNLGLLWTSDSKYNTLLSGLKLGICSIDSN